jgi:hypothetical protein
MELALAGNPVALRDHSGKEESWAAKWIFDANTEAGCQNLGWENEITTGTKPTDRREKSRLVAQTEEDRSDPKQNGEKLTAPTRSKGTLFSLKIRTKLQPGHCLPSLPHLIIGIKIEFLTRFYFRKY